MEKFKNILFIVRTEADYERAICLAQYYKTNKNISFLFIGDFTPFYLEGLQNKFLNNLFKSNGFKMNDFCDLTVLLKLLKRINKSKTKISFKDFIYTPFSFLSFKIIQKIKLNSNKKLLHNIFVKFNPDIIFTDQTIVDEDYTIEKIRKMAIQKNILVFLYSHGAAGGLHGCYSNYLYPEYENYIVLSPNKHEVLNYNNRIVTGDFSSGYEYVNKINKLNFNDISFLDNRKYKIGFFIGGTLQSFNCTNAWKVQEEIIMNFSENKNVAMVLKIHPREALNMDLRILRTIKNLKIVSNETDRSRVTKWSSIIICNDHTSVIFEPMILGKKVVAIEGHKVPSIKKIISPLKFSSVNYIKESYELCINSLKKSNTMDDIINHIAWGDNGPVDLCNNFNNIINDKYSNDISQ